MASLLDRLREAGARSRSPRWPTAPPPTPPSTTRTPWPACWTACGRRARDEQVTALAGRAAAHASLDDPGAVASLLDSLREAGAQEQVTALLRRDPAAHASLDDPDGVARLLDAACGRRARAEQVTALADRAAAHVSLDNPGGVARLLDRLREAGAAEQVTALLAVIPPPTPPSTTRAAWPTCWTGCGRRARRSRSPRWPTAPPPTPPSTTRAPWPACWTRCGRRARPSRSPRWPTASAAHVSLDNPDGVARLLDGLREAGAERAGHRAAGPRPAAHASLDDPTTPWPACWTRLREAGADEQVTALADRLPGAGMFELFREQRDPQDQFRFGREADGSPAKPWDWGDLD